MSSYFRKKQEDLKQITFGFLRTLRFVILPLGFLFLANIFIQSRSSYSKICVDPEMAYLHNGNTILHGHLPHFMDHPGFPIQYQMAFSILMHQLVYGSGSIDHEVIGSPDHFIKFQIRTNWLLFAAIIFLSGLYIFRLWGNVWICLLVQSTFLSTPAFIELYRRILPESYSLALVLILTLLIFLYVFVKKNQTEFDYRIFPTLFSTLCCLSISYKITFAPIIIIPLIVLEGLREKKVFLLTIFMGLVIFLLPIFNRWHYFKEWIFKLFFHSGRFGDGPADIVDWQLYFNNLKEILRENQLLLITSTVFFVVLTIVRRSPKPTHEDVIFTRASRGLYLFTIISIVLIAKQYKLYYLAPALQALVPSCAIGLITFPRKIRNPLACILIAINLIIALQCKAAFTDVVEEKSIDYHLIESIENQSNFPVLHYPDYYGSPFKGYSSFYGLAFTSSQYRDELLPALKIKSPVLYTYHTWNNCFNYWDGSAFSARQLMIKHDTAYMFIGGKTEEQTLLTTSLGCNFLIENTIEKIDTWDNGSWLLRIRRRIPMKYGWTYTSGFDPNLSTDFTNTIDKVIHSSKDGSIDPHRLYEKAYVTLNRNTEYGFNHRITDLIRGEKYKISVWRKIDSGLGGALVVQTDDKDRFYKLEYNPVSSENGYEKYTIDITVDSLLAGCDLKIYVWRGSNSIKSEWKELSITKVPTVYHRRKSSREDSIQKAMTSSQKTGAK